MKVTIYGATGYLGSHVAEQCLLAGHEPCCVIREGSDSGFLQALGVRCERADFSDPHALSAPLEPGAMVVNCIADTRAHVALAERRRTEVALSTELLRLAQRAGTARFVQLSTVMVYGFERPAAAIDETFPACPGHGYNIAALEREASLRRQRRGGGTELVLLRPANALGRRDVAFLPHFLRCHRLGVFPAIGGGDWVFSAIDARDVGRAIAHLLDVPVDREATYLVRGYDLDWLALKAQLDALFGRKTRLLSLPRHVALGLGGLCEALYPYGWTPPITRFEAEVLSNDTLFDDARIRATGFAPRYGLRDSLRDALAG